MFLPREKKIIELLYSTEKPFTIAQIAHQLSLSNKTISNTIKQLKPLLLDFDVALCSKPAVGIWLEADPDNLKALKKIADNSYSRGDDKKIRIAKVLLGNREYQSLEAIAEKTFYSKTTIHRELKNLVLFFKKYGLKLESKKKHGIRVTGEETNIRIVEAELIKLVLQDSTEYKLTNALKNYFSENLLTQIIAAIFLLEDQKGIELPYLSKQGLLIHLAITIDRSKNKQGINFSDEEILNLKNQEEWPLAEFLTAELEDKLQVTLDENECGYITIHLMGACLITKECEDSEKVRAISSIDTTFFQQLKKILSSVEERYNLNFSGNQEFQSRLFLHIKPMMNRLSNGITLYNPFIEEIKKFHSFAYEIATDLSQHIATCFHLTLDENEIAYIAMHIGTFLEKEDSKSYKTKIILVCASGMGTSQFLKARIENRFSEFEIVDVLSSFKTKHLEDSKEYDFILSTVPLNLENEKVIYISPLLSEEDIDKLINLSKTTFLKVNASEPTVLSEFVFPEISLFNQRIQNFEEAIDCLGGQMIDAGYVKEEFISSVLQREEISSTCIGNMIAIPHAFEGQIIKQGIGVLHCQTPISWKNSTNKVKLIFLLGIDSQSSDKFSAIFTEIANIIDCPEKLEAILSVNSFNEFEEIIQKGERYGFE